MLAQINMRRCGERAMESLPSGMRVKGDLIIDNFSIRRLPEDLRVSQNLGLYLCINIEELPPSAVIGGSVFTMHCMALMRVCEGFTAAGHIFYDSMTGFANHPRRLAQAARSFNGKFIKQ